jgi:hypothetical protein
MYKTLDNHNQHKTKKYTVVDGSIRVSFFLHCRGRMHQIIHCTDTAVAIKVKK